MTDHQMSVAPDSARRVDRSCEEELKWRSVEPSGLPAVLYRIRRFDELESVLLAAGWVAEDLEQRMLWEYHQY